MSKAIQSHNLSVGIVGLPNSGKSTLFNALTRQTVPAENFPFCTIDKNIGVVKVNDLRLDKLADFFKTAKKVDPAITFVDIAGLVKGASKGEGLGNQFLAHIREVDVILYVLRAFPSEKVVHVYDRVDPFADFDIVQSELILKDLETLEKRVDTLAGKMKSGGEKEEKFEYETLKKVQQELEKGIPVYQQSLTEEETDILYDLFLLSAKPVSFILNIREGVYSEDVADKIKEFKNSIPADLQDFVLEVDIKTLEELSSMSENEREEYLEMLDGYVSIDEIIKMMYSRLDLITFYTGSEKECNAWSVVRGVTAQDGAGVIHTDLKNNFITADVVNVEKMLEAGGWNEAREQGLVRNVGREYVVQDGDYLIVNAGR